MARFPTPRMRSRDAESVMLDRAFLDAMSDKLSPKLL